MGTQPSPPTKVHSSPISAHVYCSKDGWIKMQLGIEVGLGPGDCARWGPSSHSPKRGHRPQFSAHLRCGQTMAGWIKMPLGMEVGLGPGDCVRWGTSSIQKGHSPPQFLAHVYCGQTAGCIRIPLRAEVGLIPGEIVLDGNPAPPKETQPPIFGPCPLWPNGGWIKNVNEIYGLLHLIANCHQTFYQM